MPRYYFHTDDGRFFPDDLGTGLEDFEEAKGVGLGILWDLLRSNPDEFWANKENLRFHIVDEGHEILYTFDLTGTVAPDPFAT